MRRLRFRYSSPVDDYWLDPEPVDFIGDAQLLLTGPFFPIDGPLDQRLSHTMPSDTALDSAGRTVQVQRPTERFLCGSLTFLDPQLELTTGFAGSEQFNAELTAAVQDAVDLPLRLWVTGILFPDGYGSVAVRLEVSDGWEGDRRTRLIARFGPDGRDALCGRIHEILSTVLADIAERCYPPASGKLFLPYFNLTYAAETSHQKPGRATLPDDLRQLIYPRSPAPITSQSPLLDEFFYAGYAFMLLARREPRYTLDQLEHLLLQLNVLFARMDRSADTADQLIRSPSAGMNPDRLVALEQRLRADYQALVRPTFSYDHHVLKLRDSLLYAWETDKTRERMDTLLQMARLAMEQKLARRQAHRRALVSLVITILTVLSAFQTADAATNLWVKLFGH